MNTPNFDRIAPIYRWLEYLSFGPLLERCRFEYLKELKPAQHALILGDGDGRFTSRLFAVNPYVLVDAVDASAAMLSLLQHRVNIQNAKDRLALYLSDIRSFSPPGIYDLIISHFFLDCLTDEELRALVRRIKAALSPQALWVISEFAIPESEGWNQFATLLVTSLYKAFGWLTGLRTGKLPQYAAILRESGFVLRKERQRLGGILVSQLWQLEHFLQ